MILLISVIATAVPLNRRECFSVVYMNQQSEIIRRFLFEIFQTVRKPGLDSTEMGGDLEDLRNGFRTIAKLRK
jgi:hypothetical protein